VEEIMNPNQVYWLAEKSLWLAHAIELWTCIVYSKEQASRGLKKIADDVQ
jgi:hypothetical protein